MIASKHNPKIQWIRKLQAQSHERRQVGAFVIEGVRMVEEALRTGWQPQLVLHTEELSVRGQALMPQLERKGVPVELVTSQVMEAASDTQAPQGILAVLTMRSLPLPAAPDFLLLLDGVRDPGNLGTILRTAAAAGVQGVLVPGGVVDPFAPKVVRSAMGAHFRLPVHSLGWDDIRLLLKSPEGPKSLRVYLAEATGGVPYTQADFCSPLVIIVGGEAEGAGPEVRALVDEMVHIPMPGEAESLNAAVAAAILVFEVLRQRSAKGTLHAPVRDAHNQSR